MKKHIQVFSLMDCVRFVVEGAFFEPYIIISIQDTQNKGFGLQFTPTNYCKDVLTLYFDDIDRDSQGLQMITPAMGEQIIKFVESYPYINHIVIHCLYGQCRSKGVGAALSKVYNNTDEQFMRTGTPNMKVYRTVLNAAFNAGLLE